ncbi:MAG TPA: hypothetical protein VKD89_04520 [Candidatus Udaeobacter sp.]|nr:hypothetical protein [Candidatus Udaeobacter sp.]
MKTRLPELRAIPQFDAGRWKLRLERAPAGPDNQVTIGMEFDSVHKPRSTKPMRHIGSCYQSSAADANDNILANESEPPAISETAATSRSRYPQRN